MPKSKDQLEQVYAQDRQAWRRWLEKHHASSKGVWLVYFKVNSGQSSVNHSDAVREALCFGWIDSKVKSIDKKRYMQKFTPRKPMSIWSKLNKQLVTELINENLMTQAGLEKIEAAKKDGSWEFLDDVDALVIPSDLLDALNSNEAAKNHFHNFKESLQKQILFWIKSAKRPDTRRKRIDQVVRNAALNRGPLG